VNRAMKLMILYKNNQLVKMIKKNKHITKIMILYNKNKEIARTIINNQKFSIRIYNIEMR
jgi:hypothetical protein